MGTPLRNPAHTSKTAKFAFHRRKRYSAAAVLDADLQLPEQSELALPVAFGILGRQRVLIRAYLAPTLPSRRPGR